MREVADKGDWEKEEADLKVVYERKTKKAAVEKAESLKAVGGS